MYICENCGALLESPISIAESHDELDEKLIETYHGCPKCKSDQVFEAVQCDLCGEYILEDYVVLKDGTIACHDCYTLH